tara:strand:- start:70 stop:390 length:321 start_codon:yes stop_codon:yes gene_type:complete
MVYLFFYLIGLVIIYFIYRLGWLETLKLFISIIVPSFFIILFNLKTGKFIFKNPIIGITSILPTSIFIFRLSQPLVRRIINIFENNKNDPQNLNDVIETDSIPVDD